MRIRLTDDEVCLMDEAWGWADRDSHDRSCRFPAKEDFLAHDLRKPADEASPEEHLAYEGTILRRAAFFQYAYRRRILERHPALLARATNVLNAEQTLLRYGAVLALGGLSLEDCIPVQGLNPDCPQYRIMMDVIRLGYETQRQQEAASASVTV